MNKIEALLNDQDVWVYDDQAIRGALIGYYQAVFSSTGAPSHTLHSMTSYPPVEDDYLQCLGAPVSLEEVRSALFSMGNFKAPGPDGFHPMFFKAKCMGPPWCVHP